MMKNSVLETILGFLVLCIAAYFVFFAYTNISAGRNQDTYKLFAKFKSTGGIENGATIKMAGITIGHVVAQRLDSSTYQAVLTFDIFDNITLPEDSQAEILNDGLLGGSYIRITPGISQKIMKPGETIAFVKNFVSLEEMISKFIFLSN